MTFKLKRAILIGLIVGMPLFLERFLDGSGLAQHMNRLSRDVQGLVMLVIVLCAVALLAKFAFSGKSRSNENSSDSNPYK